MESILSAIANERSQEAEEAFRSFIERDNITHVDLIQILSLFPKLVGQYSDNPFVVENKGGSITWFGYESLIWAIGEMFRQKLKLQKKLRQEELFIRVEEVCLNRSYGKGRESFTMLLGIYGGIGRVATLLRLLDDKEVQGHAIYALRMLKASEAKEKIKPFLDSDRSWVRNEAKKYFAKMND